MTSRHKLLVVSKLMFYAAFIWSFGFVLIAELGLFEPKQDNLAMNLFQLLYGLVAGILMLIYSRYAAEKYIIIGAAFAVLSWTLGQLYWVSYTLIKDRMYPYPSVGDLGYIGTYFMLMGVIGLMIKRHSMTCKSWIRYVAFMVLLVPCFLLVMNKSKAEVLIFNFVLGTVVAFTLYKGIGLFRSRKHQMFMIGVFLLGFTDVIFMISVSLYPNTYIFISDALYVISISLISTGILRGDLELNDN